MADNNLQWKQKYYDSLDDLERREKKWGQLEELFKQAISRLTLAAEGNSKNLDNGLGELRTAIRKGKDNQKIHFILESVSKEIIKLDKQSKGVPKGDAGFLVRIIEKMKFSGKSEKKSRKLLKALKAKNPPEQSELVKSFTELLGDVVEQSILEHDKLNTGEKQKGGGFFKNLFSGKDNSIEEHSREERSEKVRDNEKNNTPEPLDDAKELTKPSDEEKNTYRLVDAEAQSSSDVALNQEQLTSVVSTVQNVLESIIEGMDVNDDVKEQLKDKLFEIKPTKEIHVLLGDLTGILQDSGIMDCPDNDVSNSEALSHMLGHNELLIRLIEFLPLEGDVKEKAEKLKESFIQGITTEELPDALKQVAGLISRMRSNVQKEQKEFEQFLKTLNGRLEEVDQYLKSSLIDYRESYQHGVELDNVVKEQVKGIGDTVSSASNIGDMEKAVQLHLDKILSHIDLHRDKEEDRVSRVEEKNKQLSVQLKEMEKESSGLRQQVLDSKNKALIDQLTQLPNRMAYDERLKQEFARWKRYNSTLLIMVWDIDFFKKVNDTYGHQAGDKVLKVVADLLRKNLRETDFVSRFGGEEFVSLMPETTLGGGFKVAEKVRNAVEKLEFHYRGSNVKVTISCGISLFMEDDTPEVAFNRADKALYQAKEEGRNRCVIAKEP
ncbi:MAG: GGDEF domain-containing protein [Gammaproteobacteria bacterium]|nr:GGDEF domain-containing protein [Gammaproteobacteria bacterium]